MKVCGMHCLLGACPAYMLLAADPRTRTRTAGDMQPQHAHAAGPLRAFARHAQARCSTRTSPVHQAAMHMFMGPRLAALS